MSGRRRLARVDLSRGEVVSDVRVGRLPVDLAAANGILYALIRTDQTVWTVERANAKARVLTRLPEYAEGMVYADDALWFLLWHGASSAQSSVLRYDLATRTMKRSAPLGANAFSLAVGHGHVFVAHGLSQGGLGRVAILDQKTLAFVDAVNTGGSPRLVTVGASGVYVADGTTLLQFRPEASRIVQRTSFPERIAAITASGDAVLAATPSAVWMLDPQTLAKRSATSLPRGAGEPRAMVRRGGTIYLTRFAADDDGEGSLLMLEPAP